MHPALLPHPRLTFRGFLRVFARFWPFVARYKGKFALGLLLILVAVPVGQFSVFLTRDVTNRILQTAEETVDSRWAAVLGIVALQACLWLVSSLLFTAREVIEWYLSMRSTYDLRMAFYRHLYRLPLSFLLQRPPGEHVYRATEDIGPRDGDGYAPGLMGMICRQVPLFFEAAYGMFWGGVLLWLVDPMLTIMVAAYAIPFCVCAHLMYDKVRLSAFAMRSTAAQEVAVLRDSVVGLRTVKALGRTFLQRRLYGRAAADTKRLQNQLSFQTVLTNQGLVWGFRFAFNLAVLLYMTHRVVGGNATIGDWVVSFLLVAEVQTPLEKAVQVVQQIRILMVPAQRVLESLDEEPALRDRPDAVKISDLQGKIEFDKVSFSYIEGAPVLKDVSVLVEPESKVGFVGPSGAGKSSLMGLLLRLYAPDRGEVRVDGLSVANANLDSLIDRCAIVPQNTYLYEGTLRENVLFGNKAASESAYLEACAVAGLDDFVALQSEGHDVWIGEGATLSGGERQRVGIARALIRDPKILILDEATASLDPRTESHILGSLRGIGEGRTVLVIAHRLKAVTDCDRVFVLDEGRIVQAGTHLELLEQQGLYRQMWDEQRAEGVLAGGPNG